GLAGGDLVMGLGVDVWVDAERDARVEPERRCRLAQSAKLRLRLDVEGEDALFKCEGHFVSGLTHAAEGDLLRLNARGQHATHPSDTTSMPAPSLASVASTRRLELALTE